MTHSLSHELFLIITWLESTTSFDSVIACIFPTTLFISPVSVNMSYSGTDISYIYCKWFKAVTFLRMSSLWYFHAPSDGT